LVISTIGKKERHREIFLRTKKIEEQKDLYLEKLIKRISKNMVELKTEVKTLRQKQESFERQSQELL
jgi:uncharacterized protein YlxW (UPF0749 family)